MHKSGIASQHMVNEQWAGPAPRVRMRRRARELNRLNTKPRTVRKTAYSRFVSESVRLMYEGRICLAHSAQRASQLVEFCLRCPVLHAKTPFCQAGICKKRWNRAIRCRALTCTSRFSSIRRCCTPRGARRKTNGGEH